MQGKWDCEPWRAERFEDIAHKHIKGRARRKKDEIIYKPIFALYLFASKQVIRAGAIGVHRDYDQDLRQYLDDGNTAIARYTQYNTRPRENEKVGRGDKARLKKSVYPWRSIPWEYIWLVQFDRDKLNPAELGIAEQVLHFHMGQAFQPYLGSSCYSCPDWEAAKLVADAAVARFQDLALKLFAPLAPVPSCAFKPT